ncbi:hypothetical protein [Paenibacillus polymyxa]|nr:hypothetical protein [Paenibacillus polymyxa]
MRMRSRSTKTAALQRSPRKTEETPEFSIELFVEAKESIRGESRFI